MSIVEHVHNNCNFRAPSQLIKSRRTLKDNDMYLYSYGKTKFYHFHYRFDDNENDIANEARIAPAIKVGGKNHRKLNEPIEK